MNLTALKKVPLLHRRLLVVGVLILIAGVVKVRLGRFPYTGTWVGYNMEKNGNFLRTSVSFNWDNSCSWTSDTFYNKKLSSTSYPCSYKMVGDSANVEIYMYNNQTYQGKWRIARTEQEKQQAPLVTATFPFKVTPQRDGLLLFVESHKTEFNYAGTDTTWSRSEDRSFQLQKVFEVK